MTNTPERIWAWRVQRSVTNCLSRCSRRIQKMTGNLLYGKKAPVGQPRG
jgi:hypothetical protein